MLIYSANVLADTTAMVLSESMCNAISWKKVFSCIKITQNFLLMITFTLAQVGERGAKALHFILNFKRMIIHSSHCIGDSGLCIKIRSIHTKLPSEAHK